MTDQLAEIKVKALDPREPWARMGDEFWWLVTEVERLRVALAEAETANELLRVEGTEESRADLEDALSEVDELSLAVVALRGALTEWQDRVRGLLSVIDKMAPASTMMALRGFGPSEDEAAPYVAICDEARAAVAAGVLNQGATDGGD